MNTFQSLCQQRRSYRKFTSEPVSQEDLDYIMTCALMSPSGKRINPWQFVVITDENKLRRLKDCRSFGSGMFATAMAAVVVALDSSLTDTWQCDGAIAAQNILLAATDRGLGACWCHVYQREQAEDIVRDVTNLPDQLTVLCMIAIGHKDEERKLYELAKLPYEKCKMLK
ncbi:MAG: nitroreductase family protein [Bacteroidales bacterium]|nr:nitroreductase family protein [Candidatus Colicola coprequi]